MNSRSKSIAASSARMATNNLWLLNPQTDLLIRLMPTQLFIDYAQIIGIVWAALMGILLIIATVKLRNQQ